MKRVFVDSHLFPLKDWLTVPGQDKIQLFLGPFDKMLEENAKEPMDLFIFGREGNMIQEAFARNQQNPLLKQFLANRQLKKVAWSMDSHHFWPQETACQEFFDTYYIAHSNYLSKFKPGKAEWLPCALQFDGCREDILPYILHKFPKTVDVVSMYHNYLHIGDRNAAAWNCWQELKREGRSVLLGQTKQWDAHGRKAEGCMQRYYGALLSGRVILNLSIMDDLNMRNFEALLLNQVMAANRVPDHDKLKLDYSNVVFFDKFDTTSFRRAMDEAMEKARRPRRNTMAEALNNHTMIHRFVTMINKQLGTKLVVPDVDVHKAAIAQGKPMERMTFSPSAEHGDTVYDEMELGIKAVYAYMARQEPEESIHILLGLLKKYPANEAWQGRLDELFFILRDCSNMMKPDEPLSIELLLQALAEAMRHAFLGGVTLDQLGQLVHSVPVLLQECPAKRRFCKVLTRALLVVAQRFMESQEWSKAVECLEKAEALGAVPGQAECLRFAEAYRKAGQPEKAVEKYTQALKVQ